MQAAETLRQRLTRAALVPALLVVAISGVFDYLSAVKLAQQAQDILLLKTATAIATRMSPDEEGESRADLIKHMQPDDAAMLRSDLGDEIEFLVTDGAGAVLAGNARLLSLINPLKEAQAETPVYDDLASNGTAVRAIRFTHIARGVTLRVLVTETTRRRLATSNRILINTVWPNFLLLLVMIVLMQRGIRKALAPLQILGNSIDRREAHDLTPIPNDQVLLEIRPLVEAISRMLERIQKTTAEQQMFLSGAAHQLRTPLAGIQTQLELAAIHATPVLRARLDRIHGAISTLAHSAQQMLTLARSSAQASTVQDFHEVDFSGLLEDAASRWLDIALQHQTELDFEVHPARCQGSRWMLQEMLGNLIDNAIKHSPPCGHVTVRCGVNPDQSPYLEVEDQGPGILAADRNKVFEPFFRSSQACTEGSGLGLSIAREVANRHQAHISFQETATRKGTRIRVTFVAEVHS